MCMQTHIHSYIYNVFNRYLEDFLSEAENIPWNKDAGNGDEKKYSY